MTWACALVTWPLKHVRRVGAGSDSLKANVRVDDESGTEESIHGGVEGAGGKGSNGQRDEGSGHESMIQSVGGVCGSADVVKADLSNDQW